MAAIGFKIDARPAEDVLDLARSVERLGFDELWVCEDLALAGVDSGRCRPGSDDAH